ncbi:MAG: hypothetical protein ACK4IX_01320 [Candidatus Sericytochromatia bacterium]
MNRLLESFFKIEDAKYPTQEQESDLIKYSKTINFRFNCLKEIESKESVIIERTVKDMMIKYPSINKYEFAYEKTKRDLTIVFRYCAQSMFRDNSEFIKDQLLYWFRTILHSTGFENGLIRYTYTKLDEFSKEELDPKTYNFLQPHLKTVIQVMSEK